VADDDKECKGNLLLWNLATKEHLLEMNMDSDQEDFKRNTNFSTKLTKQWLNMLTNSFENRNKFMIENQWRYQQTNKQF
jgi:hypothetical protein